MSDKAKKKKRSELSIRCQKLFGKVYNNFGYIEI